MSTNCLVTKLKSVVDNNNLLALGELCLTTRSNSDVSYYNTSIAYYGNVSAGAVKVYDESYNYLGQTEPVYRSDLGVTVFPVNPYQYNAQASTGRVILKLSDKYNLFSVNFVSILNLDELEYCTEITSVIQRDSNIQGSGFGVFENLRKIQTVGFVNPFSLPQDADFNIEHFKNCPLKSISIKQFENISGNIEIGFQSATIESLDLSTTAPNTITGRVDQLNYAGSVDIINIKGTNCTITQAFITSMTAAGTSVQYDDSQVVS